MVAQVGLSSWFCLSPVLVRNFIVSSKSCFVALYLQCEFVYTVQEAVEELLKFLGVGSHKN